MPTKLRRMALELAVKSARKNEIGNTENDTQTEYMKANAKQKKTLKMKSFGIIVAISHVALDVALKIFEF